jgi:Malectin domain
MANQPVAPTAAPWVAPPTFAPIRINCGGSSYLDSKGQWWSADDYFQGGDTYSDASRDIAGTVDDVLYQSERFGDFAYAIPIPQDKQGNYDVVLHFAEI